MTEIKIVHVIDVSPALSDALKALTGALTSRMAAPAAPVAPAASVAAPVAPAASAAAPAAPAASAVPEAPVVNPIPVPAPAPTVEVPTPAPTPAPAPAPAPAPVEKTYTFADISAAGSDLLNRGQMPQLMELLKAFGVQAITQLKPEQYADVAAKLRGLGAKI